MRGTNGHSGRVAVRHAARVCELEREHVNREPALGQLRKVKRATIKVVVLGKSGLRGVNAALHAVRV